MREVLLKRRLGIPAALLILLVLAGVATACVIATFTYSITTQEPLTFTEKQGLSITYQGDSGKIKVEASNANSNKAYGIFVDATVQDSQIDSITYSIEAVTGKTPVADHGALVKQEPSPSVGDLNNDGDELDARYNIKASGDYKIVVTVDSADDADSGNLVVNLDFCREAKYVLP